MLTKPVLTEVLFDEMYSDPTKGNVRFEFLPQMRTLHLQWYGTLSHEDHTKFADMTIDHIKRTNAIRWIGDVYHVIEPLPVDIAHYIADSWFPAMVKAGITKLAIVMPVVEKVKPSTNKLGTSTFIDGFFDIVAIGLPGRAFLFAKIFQCVVAILPVICDNTHQDTMATPAVTIQLG